MPHNTDKDVLPVVAVHFRAVPRSEIPAGAVAASYHLDGCSHWLVDEDAIDARVIPQLEDNGVAASALLKPRGGTSRWGLVQLALVDMPLEEMKGWHITDAGLYCPVPAGLITDHLAAEISAISTNQLSHFELT